MTLDGSSPAAQPVARGATRLASARPEREASAADKPLFDRALERQVLGERGRARLPKGRADDMAEQPLVFQASLPALAPAADMSDREGEIPAGPVAGPGTAFQSLTGGNPVPSGNVPVDNLPADLLGAFAERLALPAANGAVTRLTLNEQDYVVSEAIISGRPAEGLSITCRQSGQHGDGQSEAYDSDALRRRLRARGIRTRVIAWSSSAGSG